MEKGLQCLKSLPIFRAFPEDRLEELSKVLIPVSARKDAVIFEEGSRGNSLFLIVSGQVRVDKKLDQEGKDFKQLAIFSEGDFFGEMALVEDQVRFARAVAQTDAELMELEKSSLFKWIEKQPVAAISFFIEMVRVMSQRLRRTSSELTMLFDLSQLVFESHPSGKAFLSKALGEIMLHLEGPWSAAAFSYNPFNDEFETASAIGAAAGSLGCACQGRDIKSEWLKDSVYRLVLRGKDRPHGCIVFSMEAGLEPEERNSITVALTTVGYLLSSVLENIEHQTETVLMERLKTRKMGSI